MPASKSSKKTTSSKNNGPSVKASMIESRFAAGNPGYNSARVAAVCAEPYSISCLVTTTEEAAVVVVIVLLFERAHKLSRNFFSFSLPYVFPEQGKLRDTHMVHRFVASDSSVVHCIYVRTRHEEGSGVEYFPTSLSSTTKYALRSSPATSGKHFLDLRSIPRRGRGSFRQISTAHRGICD
jgi:hypothetical protein